MLNSVHKFKESTPVETLICNPIYKLLNKRNQRVPRSLRNSFKTHKRISCSTAVLWVQKAAGPDLLKIQFLKALILQGGNFVEVWKSTKDNYSKEQTQYIVHSLQKRWNIRKEKIAQNT